MGWAGPKGQRGEQGPVGPVGCGYPKGLVGGPQCIGHLLPEQSDLADLYPDARCPDMAVWRGLCALHAAAVLREPVVI